MVVVLACMIVVVGLVSTHIECILEQSTDVSRAITQTLSWQTYHHGALLLLCCRVPYDLLPAGSKLGRTF